MSFFKDKIEISLLVVLFLVTIFLRVPDLGYSDYIGDEHKAFIELGEGQNLAQFFLEQRKGPMQFLVSHIPYMFTGTFRNELAQRAPFTLFGILSVFVFYALVKKLTKNNWIGFVSAMLLSVNGFIIGFSRIAQYQNLNLFFSFVALYFYADFLKPSDKLLRNTLFGTTAFCFSILSHWDAIFVLVPIIYFVITFLKNGEFSKDQKKKVIVSNIVLGSAILLPFLTPYVYSQLINDANKDYFLRRVEFGHLNYERYKVLIDLYNPFLFIPIVGGLAILGLVFFKTSWIYFLWFLINYGVFEIFVRKPGTHIYNFLIPVFILAGVGLVKLSEKLKSFKFIFVIPAVLAFTFLIFQSYIIFIDHEVEYPWRQETYSDYVCEGLGKRRYLIAECYKFFNKFETKEYDVDDKLPLFGFPLKRNWNEINSYVNGQNTKNQEDFKYVSNEVKTISTWYMDADYGIYGDGGMYAVGIKYPLSFFNDWKFPQFGGKETVHEIDINGETRVRIYRLEAEDLEDLR